MENHESFEKYRTLVGDLGQTLPKLRKAEKLQIRTFLMTDKARDLDAVWKMRLSLAAGLKWSLRGIDLEKIKNPLATADLVRFIEKLCDHGELIDGNNALQWLGRGMNQVSAGPALSALLRLSRVKAGKKTTSAFSVARLDTQTAAQVLHVALRAVTAIFSSGLIEPSRKRVRGNRSNETLQIISAVVRQCETAQVSGTALEIVSLLRKGLSSSEAEKLLGGEQSTFSGVVALPAKLITGILSKGCLEDAEFLASRVNLIEEAELRFNQAIENALKDPNIRLSSLARQWGETRLGYEKPPSLAESRIDPESDLSLERMGTLLLAAWDAKSEGEKAQHLFALFSGICKTAFRMNLAGEVGSSVIFDPALHEPGGNPILAGGRVRLLRPWVEWQQGAVRRVIVRALVAPLADVHAQDAKDSDR
jgi:hypothetical protein